MEPRPLNFAPLNAMSVKWAAILVIFIISFISLAESLFNIEFINGIRPGREAMCAFTALCFFLSGLELVLLPRISHGPRKSALLLAPGVLVCLNSLAIMSQYATQMVTGRESSAALEWFFAILHIPVSRPALLTGILFLLAGIALLLLAEGSREAANVAHTVVLPGAALSYLVPSSYILGIKDLNPVWQLTTSFDTGLAFCALFVAIFCERTDTWLMRPLTGKLAGGVMTRRLLPAILLLPLLIVWVHLRGERSGVVLSESGGVLAVPAITFCFLGLMWLTAASLNRADAGVRERTVELEREIAEREKAQAALQEAQNHLTEKVAERTAQLLLVNAHLEDEMEKSGKIQRETDAVNMILRLMMDAQGMKFFLDGLVSYLKEWTGCSCAGIRLVEDGTIPYKSSIGFSDAFLEKEDRLFLSSDNCACTRVILGKPDPRDLPHISSGGSFVLNESKQILDSMVGEEAERFLGVCIGAGYKSMAIIPIREENNLIGAVHLADERAGLFSQPRVLFIEKLTSLIGEGIHKFKTQGVLVSNMAKLEALNQDLQEFAFIASHDLREPLRKIHAFGELLSQKYDREGQGGEYLFRMMDAAKRMNELIDALTRYSRVTTRVNPFVATDLGKIAREAASDLELSIRRNGVKLEIGDMPTIEADAPQMRQVFQNLIANAIKYQPDGNEPVIKIYGLAENDICRIYVEDNGIGFEQEQAERIFKPFERLHGRSSKYQGTGMGLAICRKIIERHRGSIAAKGSPGAGSTFIITLPAHIQKSRPTEEATFCL